jgi:hypothetical protein
MVGRMAGMPGGSCNGVDEDDLPAIAVLLEANALSMALRLELQKQPLAGYPPWPDTFWSPFE